MRFPVPLDWDGVSWCRWAICWPDSEVWRGILRGLITLPMRGWTWDERTGDFSIATSAGKEIFTKNLPLNGVIMACNDTYLADSFNNIAAAIQLLANRQTSGGCCSSPEIVVNNSIQNFINPGGGGAFIPVYGSEPALDIPLGEYPPEYTSFAEYDADKCKKANTMITACIVSLRAFGAFEMAQFSGLTALSVMALAGVLVIQPELIPILIGGLILLGLAINQLDAAADDMVAHYDEWVCALYTGHNVTGMISSISDLLDVLVGAIGTTSVVGLTIKTIVLVLLNTDNLNKLLTGAPMIGMGPTDCAGCAWWECAIGVIIESDANSITLEGIQTEGFDALVAVSYPNTEEIGHLSADVTDWTVPSDVPEFTSSWDLRSELCGAGNGGDWQNMSGDPESGPVLARTFQHRANTTFRVKYTRTA